MATATTLSSTFSWADAKDDTSTIDGPTHVAPSAAIKNDLIKSLSTTGNVALARAAALAKGAPRSSLDCLPKAQ